MTFVRLLVSSPSPLLPGPGTMLEGLGDIHRSHHRPSDPFVPSLLTDPEKSLVLPRILPFLLIKYVPGQDPVKVYG